MDMQIEAIASATGMSGIFKLRAADIYRVLSVEKFPLTRSGCSSDADAHACTSVTEAGAVELARKTAEFEILQRVSADINATLDLDEIYDIALRTMDELFEFHHAIILLLEPDGKTLSVVASRGYENQAIGGRVRIGTGVIGIVAQKRKMLHVGNLGQQRAYAAAQRRQMMKAGRGDGARRRRAGARASERREPDRHSAAHPRRADRRLLDRESRAAHLRRARARPRLDRRQPDCERDPQRAALRRAADARPTRCRRRTRRSRRASPSGPRRSSASCASRRSC